MKIEIWIKTAMPLVFLILILQSCATQKIMKITIVPNRDQKVGFEETITSKKKHFVSMAPYSKIFIGDRTMFMVSIQNHGELPVDVSNNDISVTFEYNTKNGDVNPVKVQILNDVANAFKMESRLNELSLINPVLINADKNLKSIIENLRRSGNGNIDANEINLEIDKIAVSIEEKRMELETMHEQDQQILEAMPDFIISQQIIMPNDSYTGVMVCDTGNLDARVEGKFKILVSIDGEEHGFTFKRTYE